MTAMTIKSKSKPKRQTRGWPPERRARQAEMIRARKPWLKSTGPKTTAGKARVRYNGLKTGYYCAVYRDLRRALFALRQDSRKRIARLAADDYQNMCLPGDQATPKRLRPGERQGSSSKTHDTPLYSEDPETQNGYPSS